MLLTVKEFFDITRKLDRNKFHICCSIRTDYQYVDWVIYRKDMPFDDYISKENKPILSSDTDTIEDLVNFCERNKKDE